MQELFLFTTNMALNSTDKKQNVKFYTEKCGFNIGEKVMDGNVEVVNFYMNR